VEEAVEHGGDGSGIAQHLAPVFDWPIRGEKHAGAFVATHDQFEEISAAVGGSLRMPRSSMMSRGATASSAMVSFRVPSRVSSASSSMRACASRYKTR